MKTSLFFAAAAAILVFSHCATVLSARNRYQGARREDYESFLTNRDQSGDFQFTQRVDHFDAQNQNTFQQLYIVNDTFFKPGGPIFFFLGGEAPLPYFELEEVSAVTWAQQFGALHVGFEHRYYGNSNPVPDFSTKNLAYLSSEQALADAAAFIAWFNETALASTPHGPWVVFGCSYSGALAAWFRLKYPQLVAGGVAASASVLAEVNYTGYLAQFTESAAWFPGCSETVQEAVPEVLSLLNEGKSGRQQLAQLFGACESEISPDDDYNFLNTIAENVASSDQFESPPYWPLNATCAILTNQSAGSSALERFAEASVYNAGPNCTDFSTKDMIEQYREISLDEQIWPGIRAWMYQSCAEFGFFQTSYPGTSVFFPNLDVETQLEWCARIFDIPGMQPDTDWTNANYGGKDIAATNVMFTNGLEDPWHLLSITESNGAGVYAVTYEAGHCAPINAPTDQDPPSLVAARKEVEQFLQSLL